MKKLASLALAGVMAFAGPLNANPGFREDHRQREKPKDPYFDISSRGRTGATERAALMAAAHRKTGVGKLNARGRDLSNPFKSSERRTAFSKAITAGHPRGEAMKIARRVII